MMESHEQPNQNQVELSNLHEEMEKVRDIQKILGAQERLQSLQSRAEEALEDLKNELEEEKITEIINTLNKERRNYLSPGYKADNEHLVITNVSSIAYGIGVFFAEEVDQRSISQAVGEVCISGKLDSSSENIGKTIANLINVTIWELYKQRGAETVMKYTAKSLNELAY